MIGIRATPGCHSRATPPWRRRPTGSHAADPFSIASSPPPSDARNDPEAAVMCRAAQNRTGTSSTVAPCPLIGPGIRRRLCPIELVVPSQVNETTDVDRHTHSRG